MPKKVVTIAPDVRAILERGSWAGDQLFKLPPGQLDRKLYEGVNKALVALGGKWNRSAGGHVFGREARADLEAALDVGHVVDVKKSLEQFFTPAPLATRMARLAQIKMGDKVLEPSAGAGALIRAAMDAGAHPRNIRAYEIDDRLRQGLHDEFFRAFASAQPPGEDFMAVDIPEEGTFDVALMNPPFSGNQDVRHVRRAWEFLKPGGRLVAIMGEHAFFSQNRESLEFMSWLDDVGGQSEELPDGTFKESGTLVSARLVFAVKREGC